MFVGAVGIRLYALIDLGGAYSCFIANLSVDDRLTAQATRLRGIFQHSCRDCCVVLHDEGFGVVEIVLFSTESETFD